MTHAEHLRGMASDERILAGRENARSTALIAGVEALEAIDRVRSTLADLRGQQEAAFQRWDDTGDTWDGAVSDALVYALTLITDALEGDT